MNNNTVDLRNCDTEPIHIPGNIQSHGFMIAIDQQLIIRFYTQNITEFLPDLSNAILGSHIQTLESSIGENEPPNFIGQLISLGRSNGFDQTNPFNTDIKGKAFHLIISQSGPYFLLEFEPSEADMHLEVQRLIGRSVSEMLADKNLNNVLNIAAQQVKKVIRFDRVMIYRFAPDGHGEVVAEARNPELESWLGLHYPASDIPKQARDLYKLNLTRLIANVHHAPSPIVGDPADADVKLDLTHSQLRAVSPIHIQYLQNMQVDSSFSISLIYYKELWGLIACHNYTPRFIDYRSRESAKLIGQILSSALEFRQDEENQQLQNQLKSSVDKLSRAMQSSKNIEESLIERDTTILNATQATGAVLIFENKIHKIGITPTDEQIQHITAWIKDSVTDTIYYTHELSTVFPEAEAFAEIASGILVCTLSRELKEYVIWFKPEAIQSVNWAGNPEKSVEISPDGSMKISPRKSFETWAQTVRLKSVPWLNEEIKSVIRLKAEITHAISQKASEIRVLNDKLREAYEELDTFSFTISHDLKNPLSTIKSYSQILQRDETISPRSQQMIERILAGANKMNEMIHEVLEYTRVGKSAIDKVEIEVKPMLVDLLKDLKMAYMADALVVNVGDTPSFSGDPLMISQVFQNLLSNAIKYSLKSDPPTLWINGTVEDEVTIYCIRDNGLGIDINQLPRIFELFKRMDNVQDIEGTGVGLAIVKRIIEKHNGRIWVDSELGKGSSFYVAFNR